ncbi:MAG: ATP-binding protein [bacterium]
MDNADLCSILKDLIALPKETEWVEFKVNYHEPQEIGEYISALSNAAGLHRKEAAYLVWGIEDNQHQPVGTTFDPHDSKVKNQELEHWLTINLAPRIDFRFHKLTYNSRLIVMMIIQPCQHTPVRFSGIEYIRIGSYKKKLKDYPEKERALWLQLSKTPFEKSIAAKNISADRVLLLVDYPSYFELIQQRLPDNRVGILASLEKERIIVRRGEDKYDITNLGAMLFAKSLSDFDALSRKAVRVIIYKGVDRTVTLKERSGDKGYATGFKGLIRYINDCLPQNEQIEQALRKNVKIYPELAIRELVANALIHQDFSMPGDSPKVEIFSDRIEITNPGQPLIDTLRFIDEPPQSRNEALAAFMRRLSICEERGSGIDKVILNVEMFQLPPPEFLTTEKHTKVILFAPKKLTRMSRREKIRACYQHACLRCVSNDQMTNASLRKRFLIEEKNYAIASRIISDTMNEKLVKLYEPDSKSKRFAKYVPFWA